MTEYVRPSNLQRDFITQARAESCIDKNVPLGFMFPARAESGMPVGAYYKWKHGPTGPGVGRFFPLHDIATKDRHAGSA